MKIYGYARVSATDQKMTRQLRALCEAGVPEENVYTDKRSGKDFDREGYRALVRALVPGDLVYVLSIDRLGRSYEEIHEEWRRLTRDCEVDVVILDMPILDTRRGKDLLGTFLADVVLQVLSFVAENERACIRERQAQGIAAARERGVRFGRPMGRTTRSFRAWVECWERGETTVSEAARALGMCRSTFYGRMKREAERAAKGKMQGGKH